MRAHWTERSIKDYLFRIVADFIAQLEKKMESENISQDELANRLGKTKGRVSQVLNHPGNISLANIIKYARTLGMKVSIIAYNDNDPLNKKGPINSEIFKTCWEECGKPHDFWAFRDINESKAVTANLTNRVLWIEKGMENPEHVSTADVSLSKQTFKGANWDAYEKLAFDLGQARDANSTEIHMLGGIRETKYSN